MKATVECEEQKLIYTRIDAPRTQLPLSTFQITQSAKDEMVSNKTKKEEQVEEGD